MTTLLAKYLFDGHNKIDFTFKKEFLNNGVEVVAGEGDVEAEGSGIGDPGCLEVKSRCQRTGLLLLRFF